MKKLLFLFLVLGMRLPGFSQSKITISGQITDSTNGESLIGATVKLAESNLGCSSNEYGFFSLSLSPGKHALEVFYVGYNRKTIYVNTAEPQAKLRIQLSPSSVSLNEVKIEGKAASKNVESVEMSTINMPIAQIKKIPAFLGEVDIIKAIQLLPGVSTAGEGSSGFFVRGGNVDQNLILLDEANVYNAAHLFGFFSVFNPDAVKDVKLYKGGIPARYGGRLASVLDVRMSEGNLKKFEANGGIGLLSSRLTLQAPIVKDKGSFLISGRRTYIDAFLKLSNNPDIKNNQLYFYDFNAKANWKFNENNRVYLSGYFGRDIFGIQDDLAKIGWGNATATARWNHIFSEKLFSNTTLIYSNYDYTLGATEGLDKFEWNSNIEDFNLKYDLNYFASNNDVWRAGISSTHHRFKPGNINIQLDSGATFDFNLDASSALESAVYLEREHKIERFTLSYGLRYTLFQNIGKGTEYVLNAEGEVSDTIYHPTGKIYNTYNGLEPRFGLNYLIDENSSLKSSYNRMRQHAQLASNSTASSPLDIWFLASPNVKPQIADQIAAGYFRNFNNNAIEASVEVYYKWMQNSIDFKNQADLLLNQELEAELRFGRSFAYGAEFFVRKNEGALTGFISYTLSRVTKVIDVDATLPGTEIYPAKYDKTHDIAVVLAYELNDKWSFGSSFVYATGLAATFPSGKFFYKGVLIPSYTERNGGRLPAYHRLDISASLKPTKKPKQKWESEWVFGIYNVYNRHNTYSINFKQNASNPRVTEAEKFYLFPIIPSVTYNFKF